jgi:phosphate-selective porin OprO and OprP
MAFMRNLLTRSIVIVLGLGSLASAASAQSLRGPDNFSVALNGFVQSRYTWLKPEASDASQNFDVALARLAVAGGAFDPKVSYMFQLEASTFGDSNRLTLLDGWMQYRFAPGAAVKAGRILLPYSRQFLTHPGNLLFTDLSAADYAFNLPRAIGVQVGGSHGRFGYDAAVANSVRALDAGGQQNRDGKLATMGRVEFAVLGPYGYLESAPAGSAPRQLSVGFAAASNPVVEGSTFQNVQPGDRTSGFTADAGYREGRVTVQAAGYQRRNQAAVAESIDRGGYIQAGVYVVPSKWEVASRASVVDFERPSAAGAPSDIREYELGINRYLHGHNVKVQGDAGLVRHTLFDNTRRDDRRVRVQFQLLF